MTLFYISTTGNDANDGRSLGAAFKTLARAQAAMRESAGEDTALVRGGTYQLKQALTLTAADESSHFKAYGSEKPHLQGGTAINKMIKGADGIWTAKLNTDDLHQVTLDGVRMHEARYPNAIANDPIKGGWAWGKEPVTGLDPQRHLTFDTSKFTKDQLKVGMKIHVVHDAAWGSNELEIKTIDFKAGMMTFAEAAFFDLGPASRFYVADGKVHLDKVGEWFFDTQTDTLHFKAPKGFDGTGVVASSNESVIEIRDTKNVSVSGFKITNSAGYAYDNYSETAGINVSNSSDVRLDKNYFLNVGKGVRVADDAHHVSVTNSTFRHIGNAAIDLNHATHHNTLTGNDIRWTNEVIFIGGAIDLKESADNRISGNLIRDVAHIGIGSVNYDPLLRSGNNLIEYNTVLHSMRETADGGAIYTYSFSDNTHLGDVIRYNRIVDSGGLEPTVGGFLPEQEYTNGIYLDDYTNNAKVYGNFIQGTVRGGIYFHGGSNNEAWNNVVIDNKDIGFQFFEIARQMLNNDVHHNIIADTYAPDGNAVEANPAFVAGSSFHDNFYLLANSQVPSFNKMTFAQWQALGFEARSDLINSAMFRNPSAGDYSLKPGSLPLLQGFIDLPWAKISEFRGGKIVIGSKVADVLVGGSGNDLLDGLAGRDSLSGGKGRDDLAGGTGNDTLLGGGGKDLLEGGSGADVFLFNAFSELANIRADADVILDFRPGKDDINLRALDANILRVGNQAFRFLDENGFDGKAGALRVFHSETTTYVEGDVNGDRSKDFTLKLLGVHNLTDGDFIL